MYTLYVSFNCVSHLVRAYFDVVALVILVCLLARDASSNIQAKAEANREVVADVQVWSGWKLREV